MNFINKTSNIINKQTNIFKEPVKFYFNIKGIQLLKHFHKIRHPGNGDSTVLLSRTRGV